MAYHLKLKKGKSYYGFGGKVQATAKEPDAVVEDEATANAAVASGYFEMVTGEDSAELLTGTLDPEQLESMKLDDLKRLAAQMGIDTKGLSKKAEFIEAITAQEVSAPAGGNEPDYTGEQ